MGPKLKISTQSRQGAGEYARELTFLPDVRRAFNEAVNVSAKKGGNFVEQEDYLVDYLGKMKVDQLYRILIDVLGFPSDVKTMVKTDQKKTPTRELLMDFVVASKIFRDIVSVMTVKDIESLSEDELKYIVEDIMWGTYDLVYPKESQLPRGQKTFKDYLISALFNEGGSGLKFDAPKLSTECQQNVSTQGSRLVLKSGKSKISSLKKHLALFKLRDSRAEEVTGFFLDDDMDYRGELALFAGATDTKVLPKTDAEKRTLAKAVIKFREEHLSGDAEKEDVIDMSQSGTSRSSKSKDRATDDEEEDEEDEEDEEEPKINKSASPVRKLASPMDSGSDNDSVAGTGSEEEELEDSDEENGDAGSPDQTQFVGEYTPTHESIFSLLMCLLDLGSFQQFDDIVGKDRVNGMLVGRNDQRKALSIKRTVAQGVNLVNEAEKIKRVQDLAGQRLKKLSLAVYDFVVLLLPNEANHINVADYRAVKPKIWTVVKQIFEQMLYCLLCLELNIPAGSSDIADKLGDITVKSLKKAAKAVEGAFENRLEVFRERFTNDLVDISSNRDFQIEVSTARLRAIVGESGSQLDTENTERFMENLDLHALTVSCEKLAVHLEEQCGVNTKLTSHPDSANSLLNSVGGEGLYEAAAWAGLAELGGKGTFKAGTEARAREERSRTAREKAREEAKRRNPSSSVSKDLFGSATRPSKRARSASGTPYSTASTNKQTPTEDEPFEDGEGSGEDLSQLDDESEAGAVSVVRRRKSMSKNDAPTPRPPRTPLLKLPRENKPEGVKRMPFSDEEDQAIVDGLVAYGFTNWKAIVEDYEFFKILKHRTAINIKDRVRTLRRLDLFDFTAFDAGQVRFERDPHYRRKVLGLASKRFARSQSLRKAEEEREGRQAEEEEELEQMDQDGELD